MNSGSHQLLAGTALPAYQHRDGTWGNLADQGHHLPHSRAIANDAFKAKRRIKFALQTAVLMAQYHGFCGALHQIAEHHQINGLFNEVVCPALQGALGGGNVPVRCDHDGLGIGLQPLG